MKQPQRASPVRSAPAAASVTAGLAWGCNGMGSRNALIADEPDLLPPKRPARSPVHAPVPHQIPGGQPMPSKFLRVKTAAVAALALLSIGGVAAAATGLAPASAERAARQASPRTPDGQVGHARGEVATLIH